MGLKFNISEGEVKRILNLHKMAINEEFKNTPTSKVIITEQSFSPKSDHTFTANVKSRALDYTFPLSFTMFAKDKYKWTKTDKGASTPYGSTYGNSTKIFFRCEGKNNYNFFVKYQQNQKHTYWYKSEKLTNILKQKFCKKQNSSNEVKNKEYAYTNVSGQNMYFRCKAYKNGFNFKYDNVFYKNTTLTQYLHDQFCVLGKSSYTQKKDHEFVAYDENGEESLTIKANSVWKWKSNNVDKCAAVPLRSGQTGAQVQGWFFSKDGVCYEATGTGGFSTKAACEKECKKKEHIKDIWNDVNPGDDDDDDVDIRNGESDDDWDFDGESSDCNNRHKTLTCSSSQRNCNEKSIRAQALINCKCPSYILDAVLRGFPKARTGNPGSYILKEDGIWGPGSKAAWETCESPIRSGSSRNDDEKDDDLYDDDNIKDDDKKDDDKKEDKDTPKPTPQKDLRLTPEEFALLIQ